MFRRVFSTVIPEHARKVMHKGLPKKLAITGVDNIVMVSSAKGGVGKSTIAVNLAIALSRLKAPNQVGLLDSDVFGPSVPDLMGVNDIQPNTNDRKQIIPIQNYGIKCMSIGSLIKKDSAVVWRGLMVMQAVQTLLRQVAWGPLNTLVVDTPPGTGDVHLSLIQNVPIRGSVVVTTSHPLSLSDTRRGIEMLLKLNVPLLGVVENMAKFVCPSCKFTTPLWCASDSTEESGAAKLADQYEIPLFCQIPFEPNVSDGKEKGIPVVISHPNSFTATTFVELACQINNLL
ncbi:Iron-sulfur protein NUBPL [Echinococcus granulosus]|uniref:Nucleotide binding protein n=1 Tax=Echinococcus granulosus TaxID=6210 RepID=U6J6U2_ECHGR|nr:Nucleotide-binding protein-like protein [Echinococcus granulosus]EUB64211.1 Nucleotide-binding protein-like protein [Echinococcus granulosus]KAH9283396.1 Iron-sulfur protein NUBPL [Echinococcus granulosus]CDS17419.1 nucleotide binding protein [Echinococcus granulosus]